MRRTLYNEDHEAFRTTVRAFVAREVRPFLELWDQQRLIDRTTWLAAGSQGIVGLSAPAAFGGAGLRDYRYRNVIMEEFAAAFATSLSSSFSLQDDILIPYVAELGTDEQHARWLPSMTDGSAIGAVAMTEPGTGSDLQGIRTSAKPVDGGWLLNGAKTFITSGIQADLVVVVARTDPAGGRHGFSLMVAERDMSGFTRGRKLDKVGMHAQDTAELFFDDVFIPDSNVLGEIGAGFGQLQDLLPLERLSIAAHALAMSRAVLASTVEYTCERKAFGQRIADFQNTRFELAELATEVDALESFVDRAILAYNDDDLTPVDAAKIKWWASDVQNRLTDRCLQLHGGYGYMLEFPVARAYQDARIQKIFGGTNEIMKHVISRDLVGKA